MKLLPFTVSVKAAPPAFVEVGDRDEIVGMGLFCGGGMEEEPPPPHEIANRTETRETKEHGRLKTIHPPKGVTVNSPREVIVGD